MRSAACANSYCDVAVEGEEDKERTPPEFHDLVGAGLMPQAELYMVS